jgi:hypothetical protein
MPTDTNDPNRTGSDPHEPGVPPYPGGTIADPNTGRPIDTDSAMQDLDPAEAEFEKRISKPLGSSPETTQKPQGDPSA